MDSLSFTQILQGRKKSWSAEPRQSISQVRFRLTATRHHNIIIINTLPAEAPFTGLAIIFPVNRRAEVMPAVRAAAGRRPTIIVISALENAFGLTWGLAQSQGGENGGGNRRGRWGRLASWPLTLIHRIVKKNKTTSIYKSIRTWSNWSTTLQTTQTLTCNHVGDSGIN